MEVTLFQRKCYSAKDLMGKSHGASLTLRLLFSKPREQRKKVVCLGHLQVPCVC